MIRVLLATLLLTLASGAAQAQLRTIPPEAIRVKIAHVQGMTVEINGTVMDLAPGAQIRDERNMIVLPTALPAGTLVKIMPNPQGQPWRIWILSAEEAAQPDAKK